MKITKGETSFKIKLDEKELESLFKKSADKNIGTHITTWEGGEILITSELYSYINQPLKLLFLLQEKIFIFMKTLL